MMFSGLFGLRRSVAESRRAPVKGPDPRYRAYTVNGVSHEPPEDGWQIIDPRSIEPKDEIPPADDVARWLHEQGYEQVDSFQELGEWFNEYAVQFGYKAVSARKAANEVGKSSCWDKDRHRGEKKKHFYKIAIPNQPNVVKLVS